MPSSPHSILSRFFAISTVKQFLYQSLASTYSSLSTRHVQTVSHRKPYHKPKWRFHRASQEVLPEPDPNQILQAISQLPARFTPEDLANTLSLQSNPKICFHLFNWATQQLQFKHDVSTYCAAIRKIASYKFYDLLDSIVDQALEDSGLHCEPLFNTIIYYYCEGGRLTKAARVFKLMKSSKKSDCAPSLTTYNLLFEAMLRRGRNSYVSQMYMETARSLFKQMIDDDVKPDLCTLNFMVKGYAVSMRMHDDAMKVFREMEVVYGCRPNGHTYNCLIFGLCAEGRWMDATALYREMMSKRCVPSEIAYNSLVNSLALGGEVDESVKLLKEMIKNGRSPDSITCHTVVDAVCRNVGLQDAKKLLWILRDMSVVDGRTYRDVLNSLEDDFHRSRR